MDPREQLAECGAAAESRKVALITLVGTTVLDLDLEGTIHLREILERPAIERRDGRHRGGDHNGVLDRIVLDKKPFARQCGNARDHRGDADYFSIPCTEVSELVPTTIRARRGSE